MFDFSDPFNQWVNFPADDWSTLPPVDDDVTGLKDITSVLDHPSDQYIREQRGRGLLLGEESSQLLPDLDLFDTMTEFYSSPNSDPGPLPPGLSPDASPASTQASSTPWLRTPQSDASLATFNALTPSSSDGLWEIQEVEKYEARTGSDSVHECGNCLHAPSLQFSDTLLEDVACSPYVPSGSPLESSESLSTRPKPTMIPLQSRDLSTQLLSPSMSPALQVHSSPLPSPSPIRSPPPSLPSQTFLAPPPTSYHRHETLSPLSAFSIFSPSPSPSPSPLSHCTIPPIIPPTVPPISPVQGEFATEVTKPTRSVRASKKRRVEAPDEEEERPQKVTKIARRKAKGLGDDDDGEWKPCFERAKRSRASSSRSAGQASTSAIPPGEAGPSDRTRSPPPSNPGDTSNHCEKCNKTFTRSSDLDRHLRHSVAHRGKRIPCPYCKQSLARPDALQRHIHASHPEMVRRIREGGGLRHLVSDKPEEASTGAEPEPEVSRQRRRRS